MSRNQIGATIVLLIIVGSVIYGTWHNRQHDVTFFRSPAFSVGHFYNFTATKSTGLEGHYTFQVNGATYGSGQTDGRYRKLGRKIFEQSFPVIYNTNDPADFQRILVFPSDFERFKVPYPDSLSWVTDLAGSN